MNADKVSDIYQQLQDHICKKLDNADGKGRFEKHTWKKDVGFGHTCVMQNSAIIEKAGVNFSYVKGDFTPRMETILGEKGRHYAAAGISSIIHPSNPWVPIIHMNVRYFELDTGKSWFGGGIDLTPHYVIAEDVVQFHRKLKSICDKYSGRFYPEFKTWADNYFYIPHRKETRGVGGIFFDRIVPGGNNPDFEQLVAFTSDLSLAYPEIYAELMKKYGSKPFSDEHIKWQKLRRGRYVEFNLIYDRGTRFGLESDGNIESILISLPPDVSWMYNFRPKEGSMEQKTLKLLRKGIDWVNYDKVES